MMEAVSVSQALIHLNELLDHDEVLSDICVLGEVSRVSKAASGHTYFTVKDADSTLDAAIFRGGVGASYLEIGVEVFAFGRVSVYPKTGRLQLIAQVVQPSGIGLLQAQFEEMKARLESEGLFDSDRKRPIQQYPTMVGVVTSENAAAWEDIKRTIRTRYPQVTLVLSHTLVQGEMAAPEIVNAIKALNELNSIDTIIVARGGGSPEDLWVFNDENVARAIFASRKPVITGIGHENDWSIADFVADVRASTPTGAAAMAVPDSRELIERISFFKGRLENAIFVRFSDTYRSVENAVRKVSIGLPSFDFLKIRIDDLVSDIVREMESQVELSKSELKGRVEKLGVMAPQNVMARGYAIIQRQADGKVIKSVSDLIPSERVSVTLSDGKVDAQLLEKSDPDYQPNLL